MKHTMVTYTVKPGHQEINAELVRAVFEELAAAQPHGFRYAVFHVPESREFIHLLTDEGGPGGLRQLPSFQAFAAEASDRHEQPSSVRTPTLIGDYGTFS
jgi:hypothetical protein